MLTGERQQKIIEYLNINSSVTVSELEKMFNVSSETVRRDLLTLESQRKLIRVHGGALSVVNNVKSKEFNVRHNEYRKEKQELCKYAAEFINEGDTVAIDCGSTAVFLCEYLVKKFNNLTIVINSIMLFEILSQKKSFHIILCGGEFIEDSSYFGGALTVNMIKGLHVSKAFLAPNALSLKFGLTVFSEKSAEIQNAFAQIADKIFVMADHSKLEIAATYITMPLNDDITVISDSGLSDDIYKLYIDADIDIVRKERP